MPQDFRAALHAAVDAFCDAYVGEGSGAEVRRDRTGPVVRRGRPVAPWTHTFPDGTVEEYSHGESFEIESGGTVREVRLGWATRQAWGRDRRRAVVFAREGSGWYPWSEFVETDGGQYASAIPNPRRPRAILADGDPIPAELADADIRRLDALFAAVARGPSLRRVVPRDDTEQMVRHGFWVAALRGRA